jgi:hypothetical protein
VAAMVESTTADLVALCPSWIFIARILPFWMTAVAGVRSSGRLAQVGVERRQWHGADLQGIPIWPERSQTYNAMLGRRNNAAH